MPSCNAWVAERDLATAHIDAEELAAKLVPITEQVATLGVVSITLVIETGAVPLRAVVRVNVIPDTLIG